ncbi:imelysin family protein [Jiella sp. M17.18]|uniref:imelysin family protein n=1 Tax=Jiella sp. M17.18 TaxID=3234247 RepID=UPI0034DE2101
MPKPDAPRRPFNASRRRLQIAAAAVFLLAVAALAILYAAGVIAGGPEVPDDAIPFALAADGGCEPDEVSAAAGRQDFAVVSRARQARSWRLSAGGLVVAEAADVAPGETRVVSLTLWPGDYGLACEASGKAGILHAVAPKASGDRPAEAGIESAFAGSLAAYRTYLDREGASLSRELEKLRRAVVAGNLADARTVFLAARLPYDRLEPLALRFPELTARIDAEAEAFDRHAADPHFSGFHRIEYGLFARNGTEGLAPVVAALEGDVKALRAKLKALPLDPGMLVKSAARICDRLAAGQVVMGRDLYSKTDLADIRGNVDGIDAILSALKPAETLAPKRMRDAEAKRAAVDAAIADLEANGRFISYDTVEYQDRGELSFHFNALAAPLDRLEPVLQGR